jgi:hypothetical protein
MNAIETKVLELVGENVDDPDVFDETGIEAIRDSINDAIQEIAILTGGFKRQYFLPFRSGQSFYRLSPRNGHFGWVTDVWDIVRKIRLEQTDLIRLSHHDPRWMVSSGDPAAYVQLGKDVIGFYRKPSASSGGVEITIVEIPDEYESDTDRIKLRDSFQSAAVHFAVGEFWASRGDAREAASHGRLYLEALGMKEMYSQSRWAAPSLSTFKEPWPKATS